MGTTSAEGSNAELVRTGYEALNRRDPERVLAVLGPDTEFRFCPPGGGEEVLRGAEELREFYNALYRIFDLVELDCRKIEAGGNIVHVQGSVTLRVRDTRQATHASFRHTYRFRDGAVASVVFEDPVNPLELMRAAAEMPASPAE